jgi:hypothetical protein
MSQAETPRAKTALVHKEKTAPEAAKDYYTFL